MIYYIEIKKKFIYLSCECIVRFDVIDEVNLNEYDLYRFAKNGYLYISDNFLYYNSDNINSSSIFKVHFDIIKSALSAFIRNKKLNELLHEQ